MNRLATLALVILFGLSCWCNAHAQLMHLKDRSGLFPISANFKRGYIDSTGQIAILPRFDDAQPFSEGLAAVKVCTKYGYIDTTGKMIIEPQFQFAEPFSDGMAWVRFSTNEIAYVDRSGKIAFTLQSGQDARAFSDGLAPASSQGRWGFIDKRGHYAIAPQFDRVLGFSEGLAAVAVGNKFGFINRRGKYVVAAKYDSVWSFSEGRAPVQVRGKWGFIDKTGTMVVPPKFDAVGPFFSEGLIEVKDGDKWGFSDRMGNLVIPAKFDGPTESVWFVWFSDGLAPVRVGSLWGFVDRRGKMVIEPRVHLIAPFINGLAVANVDGKVSYIDKTGNPVHRMNDSPSSFSVTNTPIPPGTSLEDIMLDLTHYGRGSERRVFVSMSEELSRKLLTFEQPPVYSEQAKAARVEGTVTLKVAINTDGNVVAVRVVSGEPLLAATASEAVKQWRYEPFLYECEPVPVATRITLEYKLPRP